MKKTVLLNIMLNVFLTIIFVLLNMWALNGGLGETFVFLAVIYGFTVVLVNALWVAKISV